MNKKKTTQLKSMLKRNGFDLDNLNHSNPLHKSGDTAFIYTIFNHPDYLNEFLTLDIDINAPRNSDGFTPLMGLCSVSSFDFIGIKQESTLKWIKKLIKSGVDLEKRECEGWTALMVACFNSTKEVVEFLIESGANLNVESEKGQTCLEVALESLSENDVIERREVISFLEKKALDNHTPHNLSTSSRLRL